MLQADVFEKEPGHKCWAPPAPPSPPPPPPSEPEDPADDDPPTDRPDSPSRDTRSIDQGAINAAVVLALSNPGVLRSLASAVQATGGTSIGDSGPSSAVAGGSGTDGKLSVVLAYHGIICWPILLTSGSSPLGELPLPSEIAALGLQSAVSSAPSSEEPIVSTAVSGTESSSSGHDPCSVIYSGQKKSPSEAVPSGFSLGHGFPLIPGKLVAKIENWEYVSMADLLPDNLELARRSQSEIQQFLSCSAKAPKKRELTEDWKGLVAWSVSFSTFIAIVARKHPGKFQELLAYHATVLIEALRFGCRGWLSYDKMFREHIEKEPQSSWAMLHPIFYSLTFLSQRVEALTCPRCMAPDHLKANCALASIEPSVEQHRNRVTDTRQSGPSRKRFRREGTPTSQGSESSSGRVAYCFSFIKGQCYRHPKPCEREHRCIRCGKEHRLIDCKATFVPTSTSSSAPWPHSSDWTLLRLSSLV